MFGRFKAKLGEMKRKMLERDSGANDAWDTLAKQAAEKKIPFRNIGEVSFHLGYSEKEAIRSTEEFFKKTGTPKKYIPGEIEKTILNYRKAEQEHKGK